MQAKMLFVHALSPLHAGTGQGVGVIDLPIAREKATGIPFVPGSSIKGVLRDACSDPAKKVAVFGPETDRADEHAGSAHFSDSRLLLLPVRSLAGTFGWVTSPLLLRRCLRDAEAVKDVRPPTAAPVPATNTECVVATGCALRIAQQGQQRVVLEDLLLEPREDAAATTWASWLGGHLFPSDTYWQEALKARLCIVHDDVLGFLLQTATEITARIQLEAATKTVKRGALWYEEALPAETVLAGLLVASPVKAEATEVFTTITGLTKSALQIGGNATVGRGLCQLRLI